MYQFLITIEIGRKIVAFLNYLQEKSEYRCLSICQYFISSKK